MKTITGVDATGTAVAKYELKLGKYVMSAYFADGQEGLTVDGRRITIDVDGQHGYYEGVDYPPMNGFPPPGNIATFVHDPHVAPILASWGIQYRMQTSVATLPAERGEEAYDGTCTDCDGVAGFTASGGCTNITCGYIAGVSGTGQVSRSNPSALFDVGSGGGCTGTGCNVCSGGSGPADYAALINADTTTGEMDTESYLAQLCENVNGVNNGGNTGPFFALKACRPVTNSTYCPSGGNWTGCGCAAGTAKCGVCTNYASGAGSNQSYAVGDGDIDNITSPYLEWGYHNACYPSGNFCTASSECCSSCSFSGGSYGYCY